MIYLAKVLSLILGSMVIAKTYLDFKKKRENVTMFLFWVTVWLVIILLALFPFLVDRISSALGSQDTGLNTLLSMALVFQLFVIYRIYIKANRIEQKLREVVKKIGLKKIAD